MTNGHEVFLHDAHGLLTAKTFFALAAAARRSELDAITPIIRSSRSNLPIRFRQQLSIFNVCYRESAFTRVRFPQGLGPAFGCAALQRTSWRSTESTEIARRP